MALENCLGLTADKLKLELKQNAEPIILEEVVNKTLYNENKEEKKECEVLCEKSVLSKFNEFLIDALKKEFDKINLADKLNLPYDISNLGDNLRKSILDYMKDFNKLVSDGKGKELSDLINNKAKNDSLFPNNISNNLKQDLLKLLDKSNYLAKDVDNPNSKINKYRDNSIVINTDEIALNRNTEDDLFSNTRPINDITIKEIESINRDKSFFKCFKKDFKISDYIVNYDKDLIVTNAKIENLKRIHNDILIPIYKYYYGEVDDSQCNLKIYYGVLSLKEASLSASGSFVSKHISGEAVDFKLIGIPDNKIIQDLKNKNIEIDFGIAVITNGIHITLPYYINNVEVKNVILSSRNNTNDSLVIDFI